MTFIQSYRLRRAHRQAKEAKTFEQLQAAVVLGFGALAPQVMTTDPALDEMTDGEISRRIDEVSNRIKAATGWGAALTALDEERKELRSELARRQAQRDAEAGQ